MMHCNTYHLVARGRYSSDFYTGSYLFRRPSRFSMSVIWGRRRVLLFLRCFKLNRAVSLQQPNDSRFIAFTSEH